MESLKAQLDVFLFRLTLVKSLRSFISDDNGASWKVKVVPLPSSWSAEAQFVELSPGVIQAYMRTNNGKIAYLTSKDAGTT